MTETSDPIVVRFRLSAEIPSLPVAKSQQAVNQTVSGVRVRSKIVPAVTEVRPPHLEHMYRPSASRQPVSRPQPEQAKPAGHRSHSNRPLTFRKKRFGKRSRNTIK